MEKFDGIIKRAIKKHQGKILSIGTLCAHPSDHMTYELIGYDGDKAILSWNGITKYFPANEIFDVNKVKDMVITIHIAES